MAHQRLAFCKLPSPAPLLRCLATRRIECRCGPANHARWGFTPRFTASRGCSVRCISATAIGGQHPGFSGQQRSSDQADAVDFELQHIPGDGSCLFRALAAGAHQASTGSLLTGPELLRAGFDLRQKVCAEMVQRRAEIEPFISGVFDAYVHNMALEGIWGGEPELAVAVHCLQRPIIVYKQVGAGLGLFGKSLVKVSEYGADQYTGVAPVCVLFSGAHYDLLVQRSAEQ